MTLFIAAVYCSFKQCVFKQGLSTLTSPGRRFKGFTHLCFTILVNGSRRSSHLSFVFRALSFFCFSSVTSWFCPPASDSTSVPSSLLPLVTLVPLSHGSKCLLWEKVWGVRAECRAINAFTATPPVTLPAPDWLPDGSSELQTHLKIKKRRAKEVKEWNCMDCFLLRASWWNGLISNRFLNPWLHLDSL